MQYHWYEQYLAKGGFISLSFIDKENAEDYDVERFSLYGKGAGVFNIDDAYIEYDVDKYEYTITITSEFGNSFNQAIIQGNRLSTDGAFVASMYYEY